MHLDFWFDPSCPYTWITSRWVCRLAPERGLRITWRPFSLAILHADEGPSDAGRRGLGQLRVIEAMHKAGLQDRVGQLYTELGQRTHDDRDKTFPVVDALASVGLPLDLADAEDDESLDDLIRSSMDQAMELSGDDTGVPVIAWGEGESRVGFFGPILTAVPDEASGEALFDALLGLAAISELTEVKRCRTRPVLPAVAPD